MRAASWALTALAATKARLRASCLLLTGVLGASLSMATAYAGDLGVGAIEGLEVITPAFAVRDAGAALIIVALFMFQRFGTEAPVGKLFGPVIMLWFAVLPMGVLQIVRQPAILEALEPDEALAFLHARAGWFRS